MGSLSLVRHRQEWESGGSLLIPISEIQKLRQGRGEANCLRLGRRRADRARACLTSISPRSLRQEWVG